MRKTIRKYVRVWKQLSALAIGSSLTHRIDSLAYFTGKTVRFGLFLLLIVSLFRFTDDLAGYTRNEAILFFLTFNLIDVFAQALFRGIYLFRQDIARGNFDLVLVKPVNPLFYSLTRLTDVLDIAFLVPIVFLIVFFMRNLPAPPAPGAVLLYIVLVLAGLMIVLGIHIISASVTIWKTESENFIWLYRDSMTIGRFPPDIYSPSIRIVFTFVIPIITAVAFPVKGLLQHLGPEETVFALVYAAAFFGSSLGLWRASLRSYSSASS